MAIAAAAVPWIVAATATATAAGAGVMAYSQYQAGKSQQALANYNAMVARQQGDATRAAAAQRAQLERKQNELILSRQIGEYVASGVVVNSGSPLINETRQAGRLELRAQQTEYEGDIAARADQSQSILDVASGNAARQGAAIGAAGTILSGVGQTGQTLLNG